jgi:hypothetical protein
VNDSAVAAQWTVNTGYSNGCGDICNQNLISNENRSAFHVTVDFSQECGVDGVCTASSPDHVIYSVIKTGYKRVDGSLAVSQNDNTKTVIVHLVEN